MAKTLLASIIIVKSIMEKNAMSKVALIQQLTIAVMKECLFVDGHYVQSIEFAHRIRPEFCPYIPS